MNLSHSLAHQYHSFTINYNYNYEACQRFRQFVPSQATIQALVWNSQQNEEVPLFRSHRIRCISFSFQIHPSQSDLFVWADWVEQDADKAKPRAVTSIKWLRNRVFIRQIYWWCWEYFKGSMPNTDRNSLISEWMSTIPMEISSRQSISTIKPNIRIRGQKKEYP